MSTDDTALRKVLDDAATAKFGPGRIVQLAPLDGGRSGVTHRVTIDHGGTERTLVVKSSPEGRTAVGRHDVLRQAKIVAALGRHGAVPVPEVVLTADGPPAVFAGSLAPGVARDPILAPEDPAETPELIAASWDAAITLLATMHRIDPAELGLADEPVRTPAEELDVWTRTMTAGRLPDPTHADRLAAALAASIPTSPHRGLVHGDFRLGNLLMDGATPTALIDWEIWTIGDPAVDLGWLVQFTDPANYPGVGREAAGTPSADDVIARYLEAVGRTDDVSWFIALGCFKLAAIQAHNRRRHEEGRHHDPFQELLGPSIDRLIERGLERMGQGVA